MHSGQRISFFPTQLLFGSTIFLGAFLLFLVEPMAAKQLVPLFGGSAAVWLTSLVFFQTAVLGGYLYAHWQGRLSSGAEKKAAWLPRIHGALLVCAGISALAWSSGHFVFSAASSHPVAAIFKDLTLTVGLPFFLLACTSPLLQLWFARLSPGVMPYRLFALSNLASLLALAAYPTLVEPYLTLRQQQVAWCCGLLLFVGLSVWALLLSSAREKPSAVDMHAAKTTDPQRIAPDELSATLSPTGTRLLWLLLPMGAGMQLSAVTSHLTANIAAIPLLWILPLAVYLVTLIVAFEYPWIAPPAITLRLTAVMLASLGYMLTKVDADLPIKISIPIYLAELLVACLFLHSAAYTLRPRRTAELTTFYLLFAAGGALGSFAIGIAAPLLFSSNYDLALSFLVSSLLILAATWRAGWQQRLIWSVGSALLVYLVVLLHQAFQHHQLLAVRNFYGSLRVEQANTAQLSMGEQGVVRSLINGSIRHGTQIFTPALRRTPTTYYAEDSGIGLALRFCCGERPRRIGVVGLGVGTIAAYGRSGDTLRFYELNPAVPPIAQNVFTYLRDTPAQVAVIEGDARASLSGEAAENFDVLAIDAFSGDSIPLHLLTREAMALYRKHLAPGGILAFHVSNQYVDLEPQISLLARDAGMQARTVVSARDDARGEFEAEWVLVTANTAFLEDRRVLLRLNQAVQKGNVRLWTDDYSSLLPVLHW